MCHLRNLRHARNRLRCHHRRTIGTKKDLEANKIFTFISVVLLGLSIFFTVIGIIFLKPICIFLGSSDRLLEHVIPYALVLFMGAVPMSFKLFFEYLVRSDGISDGELLMSLIGLILNVIFDYIFVSVFYPSEYHRYIGGLADNADGGGCDYFYIALPVPQTRKMLYKKSHVINAVVIRYHTRSNRSGMICF